MQKRYTNALISTAIFSVIQPLIPAVISGKEFDVSSWAISVVIFMICMLIFAGFQKAE